MHFLMGVAKHIAGCCLKICFPKLFSNAISLISKGKPWKIRFFHRVALCFPLWCYKSVFQTF